MYIHEVACTVETLALCMYVRMYVRTLGVTGLVSCRMKSVRLLVLMAARGDLEGASRTIRNTGRYTSLRLKRQFLIQKTQLQLTATFTATRMQPTLSSNLS